MAMAELGPHDIGSLLRCFQDALSLDKQIQKQAEALLQVLSDRPGFCACLAEIIGHNEAEHSARWLASVNLKHSINRNWKPRGGINDQERAFIRGKVLDLFEQEDARIAVQFALAVARIARIDYPSQWPSLFEDILQRLQGSSLSARRVYLVIHHILKELASKRLAADQAVFAEVTTKLFERYWRGWCDDTQQLLSAFADPAAVAASSNSLVVLLERWLFELKGLRRMLILGFPSDAKTLKVLPQAQEVIRAFLEALYHLLPLRAKKSSPRSQPHAMLDRGIIKLAKSLRNMVETHPWAMYEVSLFPALEFVCNQIVSSHQDVASFNGFFLECMLFVHGTLKNTAYEGKIAGFAVGAAAKAQAAEIKTRGDKVQTALKSFWTAERLSYLAMALIAHYFLLTESELGELDENPEQFHHQAVDVGAWQDNLRTCAENLFALLISEYSEELAPVVVRLLQETQAADLSQLLQMGQNQALPLVLKKEAVYNAACVGQYVLYNHVDWNGWLHTTLLPELSCTAPLFKSVRRRIVFLIGAWTPQLPKGNRDVVYRILADLLVDSDLAIRLAAVANLRNVVDDWDFDADAFRPYTERIITSLGTTLKQSQEFDTQLQVLHLVNTMVERLHGEARPVARPLLEICYAAFEDKSQHSMLKIQALLALQQIVNAMDAESSTTYPVLIPVLMRCTDPSQPDELNLLEDGLQLWLVALRNAIAPDPQLVGLFPNLSLVLDHSTEHVQVATQIMSCCLLLGGVAFLQHYGTLLVRMLCNLLTNISQKGLPLVFPVLEGVLQISPTEGPLLLEPCLQQLFVQTLSYSNPSDMPTGSLGVFARLTLQNRDFVPQFMERLASTPHLNPETGVAVSVGTPEQAFAAYLDRWLENFDRIGSPGARKLSALAFCNLLGLRLPVVIQRFGEIVSIITGTYYETEGLDSDPLGVFLSTYDYHKAGGGDDDANVSTASLLSEDAQGESTRRRQLLERDPVNNLKVSSFLAEKLTEAAAVHGPAFHNAASSLDPTLESQLRIALGQTT